jgi:hypothetical protein
MDFFMYWEVMKELSDEDSNIERSSKVIRNVEEDPCCYKEVFADLRRLESNQL